MKKPALLSALGPVLRRTLPLLLLGLLLPAGFHSAGAADSKPPDLLIYQGYLADGNGNPFATNNPVNYDVVFRIYDAQNGGNVVWAEKQTVTVDQGQFSVLLGEGAANASEPRPALNALFASATASDRYMDLTVKIGGADVNIAPRLRLVTSPYAFHARTATALVNPSGTPVITSDNSSVSIAGSIIAPSLFARSAANPYVALQDAAGNEGMTLAYASGAGAFSSWAAAEDTVLRAKSGKKLLLQTGTGGAGIVIDSGNNVGIGTVAPLAKLHVNGSLAVRTATANDGYVSANPGSSGQAGYIGWHKPGGTRMGYMGFDPNYLTLILEAGAKFGVGNGDLAVHSGNIGINTWTPSTQMEIYYGSDPENSSASPIGGLSIRSAASTALVMGTRPGAPHSGWLQVRHGTVPGYTYPLELQPLGNHVGIGRSNPEATLTVQSSGTPGWGTAAFYGPGMGPNISHIQTGPWGHWYIRSASSSGNVILQDTGGNVGIGTSSPTQGRLVVTGGPSTSGIYGYYIGSVSAVTHGAHTINIRATDSIWVGANVLASSDERIKNIVGRSDRTTDLRTLLGIEVTDYRYKDEISRGKGLQKKVIAQQVEKAFPLAVTKQTDTVPDIFKQATIKDGWVALKTDLQVGERVKLIAEKFESICPVLEVKKDKFRVDFKPAEESSAAAPSKAQAAANAAASRAIGNAPEETVDKVVKKAADRPAKKIFVYGREVKDFRVVDYDAIAMLNVSATQELARRLLKVEQRETQIAELERKAGRVEVLEQDVAELKKLVVGLADKLKGGKAAAAAPVNKVSALTSR